MILRMYSNRASAHTSQVGNCLFGFSPRTVIYRNGPSGRLLAPRPICFRRETPKGSVARLHKLD